LRKKTYQSEEIIERRLRRLSSEAAAQAAVTMHADVEWRRVCALATAWEIYASEEHLKFLHMVLEDEGKTYASAAQEPLGTSIQELVTSHKDDIEERIDSGVAAYSEDVTSFAVGDAQLEYFESTRTSFHVPASVKIGIDNSLKVADADDSDDSGVALTNSDESRFRDSTRKSSKFGGSADDC
jgi:hypothetical protein